MFIHGTLVKATNKNNLPEAIFIFIQRRQKESSKLVRLDVFIITSKKRFLNPYEVRKSNAFIIKFVKRRTGVPE